MSNPTPEAEPTCARCHAVYELGERSEPTRFCDSCAQDIVEELLQTVPEPPGPKTLTEVFSILRKLQKELYP